MKKKKTATSSTSHEERSPNDAQQVYEQSATFQLPKCAYYLFRLTYSSNPMTKCDICDQAR